LPFDLHPEYPPEGIGIEDLGRRYGFDPNAHHEQLFGENDLPWIARQRIPNSHAALNAAELARERGVHEPFHARLMTAYWAEDRDISDPELLAREGDAFGLDHAEVMDAATSKPFEDRIRASTQAVVEMGGNGVPAFVVDDKILVPGAQPHSLFEKVMERFGHEPLS
jgi:predicted DsbA family dithiol-disulfide isomerase